MRVRLQRMRGEVRQEARSVQTGRRGLLLAVLNGLQTPGWYQRLCGQGAGRHTVCARWPMRRYLYDAAAGVDETSWEDSEGGEKFRCRRAMNGRRGVCASVGRAVVVVLLRQLLFGVVIPRPPAIVENATRGCLVVIVIIVVVVIVVALFPRPLPLLVAVRFFRGRALGILDAALAQQATYAERMATGRVVRQRSRADLTGGRRSGTLGGLLGHVAAIVTRVISRTAASGIRIIHIDLLRRVHVAVAVLRHNPFLSRELGSCYRRQCASNNGYLHRVVMCLQECDFDRDCLKRSNKWE